MPAIETQTRRVFYSPTAGRAWLTKRAAYMGEVKARFYSRCDCEPGGHYEAPARRISPTVEIRAMCPWP